MLLVGAAVSTVRQAQRPRSAVARHTGDGRALEFTEVVVRLATDARRAARAAALLALTIIGFCALADDGQAQITLGSPADPPRFALGAGAFDVTPSDSNHGGTAAELRAEYRFGDVLWFISPFVGVSGTSDGAFYGFGGFGIDINLTPNLVLTPNAAAGYFARGSGTNLGSWWEFRTGAEFAWRFADRSRIGVAVHHTSNAGLTRRNPGAQSVVLMYSLPMR